MSLPQNPLRALIWCSVSTKGQAEDDKTSLPEQEREARAIAEREGWRIIDVLIVPGHSRRYYDVRTCADDMLKEGIDAFDKLIRYWETRAFDVLIVRDGNRFARTQALHAYVVERTVDECNARIFVTTKGWVDRSNFRMFTAMDGYSAASDIDRLVQGMKATKDANVRRGIYPGRSIPFGLVAVRNEYGKMLRLEVDESQRRLYDDLATVLCEGIGWDFIEKELYQRYGHVDPRTGKPFTTRFFYQALHNAWFWGNGARHYKNPKVNGQRKGLWIFDPDVEAPPGVIIEYGTHPAVYTGEQAEKVKAELRRRYEIVRGKTRPHSTKMFTGLLLCDYCGYYMISATEKHKYSLYRCMSKRYTARSGGSGEVRGEGCVQFRRIHERVVKDWVNARLQDMLEYDLPDLLAREPESDDLPRADLLREEIEEARTRARRLIEKQAIAPPALANIYDEELQTIAERLEILTANLRDAERRERQKKSASVQQAYDELAAYESLEAFWQEPSTKINQLLLRLLGNMRLVVRDGQIIGTRRKPPHHKARRRAV